MTGGFSVARRILLVLVIGTATPAFVLVHSLWNVHNSLIEARSNEVRHLDETAWAVVADFQARAARGAITEAAAKDAARETIRAMRYDDGNYFFIWDLAGTGVAHGGNRALEGRSFLDGPDAKAKPGVADMVGKLVGIARRQGQGFTRYKIPKSGSTVPLDKIGYCKLFEPWGWVIGTGAYVSDIDSTFWRTARSELAISACLTCLAGLVSYLLGRDLSRALARLTEAMRRLATGDLSTVVPSRRRGDEVGVMAGTVQVFKDGALHTRNLERDKAAEQKVAAEAASLVVEAVGRGLERLAAGDLTYRLETPLPTAYEKLRLDMNSAMGQLEGLVECIAGIAFAVRAGTGEMSLGAVELSSRTEGQAASLVKTAAALDAITSTVRHAADSTEHAHIVVRLAQDDATHTAGVVRDTVEAMGEIERSSVEIASITALIDDIAFQTSLLALNAAVEAAQAGYAGGFTIVAAEVRALAQRSSEAAKQIKGLIASSSRHVVRGVKLVGDAGQALDRIVGQVGEISTAIAGIALSAQAQASSLHQVNGAVHQMDHATQQNAAMVEQSTAAMQALMTKAERLAELAGRFRVGHAVSSALVAAREDGPAAQLRRTESPRVDPGRTSFGGARIGRPGAESAAA